MTAKRKRTTPDSAATRDRILTAAEHLFAERGFDGTTTKAIAEEADVPTGLIFYHFDTKDGLLAAVLDKRALLPRARRIMAEAGSDDPRENLLALGLMFLSRTSEDGRLNRILLREVHIHPTVSRDFDAMVEQLLDLVAGEFARVSDHGARVAARTFLFSTVFAGVFHPPEDPEAYLRETLDLLCPEQVAQP